MDKRGAAETPEAGDIPRAVNAKRIQPTGWTPVKSNIKLHLVMLPENTVPNLSSASWTLLHKLRPKYVRLIAAGAAEETARARYTDLVESRPLAVACLLNISTVADSIPLAKGSILDYMAELIWDTPGIRQDRFFAWADRTVMDQLALAQGKRLLIRVQTAGGTAGAEYREVATSEAPLCVIVHENDRKVVNGVDCVRVELSLTYMPHPDAHCVMKVNTPSPISPVYLDPLQMYALRWISNRRQGLRDFDSGYTAVGNR